MIAVVKHWLRLVATPALLGLIGIPVAAAGAVSQDETVADFGTFNQLRLPSDCKNIACGPVATINSFIYLQKTYPKAFDNKLVPSGKAKEVVDMLAGLMACMGAQGGTTAGCLVSGMRLYFSMVELKNVEVKAQSFVPKTTDTFSGKIPTPDFLFKQLPPAGAKPPNGEDIEMLLGFYTKKGNSYSRTAGHWVTVTGAAFNDNNNTKMFGAGDTLASVSFIDPLGKDSMNAALMTMNDTLTTLTTPWGSMMQISNYFANASPLWNTAAFGKRTDANTTTLVDALVAESPVPEPPPLASLAVGFAALVLAQRGSRARNA